MPDLTMVINKLSTIFNIFSSKTIQTNIYNQKKIGPLALGSYTLLLGQHTLRSTAMLHEVSAKKLNILSINKKSPPPKFQYFEKYKITFKNFSFIHDSG